MANNAIIIHGGGLVDPSKEVILRITRGIYSKGVYDEIFIGRYSFLSLIDPNLWIAYNSDLEETMKKARGTCFGTCREFYLTDPENMERACICLTRRKIKTVIVCGGDGSSRNCAEINKEFCKFGINIIFAVPLTVDGINGGWSIGIEQAVRESIRQIENVVATSLETLDKNKYGVVAVELQGRNRDDILARVLQHFYRQKNIAGCPLNDILLRVVPANYINNDEELIREVNESMKRTLIIISEGANLKLHVLQKTIFRKLRTLVVGHSVQSNGLTTKEDMETYSDWITDVVNFIVRRGFEYSFSIVNDGISRWIAPIDYYAKLNPLKNQKVELSEGLKNLIEIYMA